MPEYLDDVEQTRTIDPGIADPQLRPPKFSWSFFLGTWTGRLILINTLIFILMVWESGSILLPSNEVIEKFGAKTAPGLVSGEYYRFFTSMFVHVGIIHFGINMLALAYIGAVIESLIGARWFLVIYLLSGLCAGVASGFFTLGTSAGASGAIFGLIGTGLVVERLHMRLIFLATGQRPQRGIFTGLAIINIILGFILTSGPIRIDNAGHLGGLVGGMALTLIFLWTHKTPLLEYRPLKAIALGALLTITGCVLAYFSCLPEFLEYRIATKLERADTPQERYEALTEIIQILPHEKKYYYERGVLLLQHNGFDEAKSDFDQIIDDPFYQKKLRALSEDPQLNLEASRALKSYLKRKLSQT